jgi:hypothetical protein
MDWIQFLDDYHIPYVTRGPNTKRGEISVQCPFCGDDDPSEHLGINPDTGSWGCLRNSQHRGTWSVRLIAALAQCSTVQAKALAKQYNTPDPSNFDTLFDDFPPEEKKEEILPPEKLPDEFHVITKGVKSHAKYWWYLYGRGFKDVRTLVETNSLRCCNSGPWKDRIIIPVYFNKKLVGWTARALGDVVNAPRYMESSKLIKKVVYLPKEYYDDWTVKNLFITEGPFDAMKLEYHLWRECDSTCTFGTSFTVEQVCILRDWVKAYNRTVILFDKDAVGQAFQLQEWLDPKKVVVGDLSVISTERKIKDPGDLNEDEANQLLNFYQNS